MKRQHLNFDVWKKRALKNPGIKEEYDRLQPEFEVINAHIQTKTKIKSEGKIRREITKKVIDPFCVIPKK